MPSGNAQITFLGPEDTVEIPGVVFTKGETQIVHDNGVIAACIDDDRFTVGPIVPDGEDPPAVEDEAPKPKRKRTAK